jgi:AcrR family transcriptional regulator
MEKSATKQLHATPQMNRGDWLHAALQQCEFGVDTIKVAALARGLGVTTGSFYWHFKNRRALLEALLDYWEYEMTDAAIIAARQHQGSPSDRILYLMETVLLGKVARYDMAIAQWAKTDCKARSVFKQAIKKRFEFAAWMFAEARFSREQAEARGRLMVTYMMTESTLIPDSISKRRALLKLKHSILMTPE